MPLNKHNSVTIDFVNTELKCHQIFANGWPGSCQLTIAVVASDENVVSFVSVKRENLYYNVVFCKYSPFSLVNAGLIHLDRLLYDHVAELA